MITDQPVDTLLTQFLDALPDAALYVKAVRDDEQRLTDLRVSAGNQKGCALIAQGFFDTSLGERILGDNPERRSALEPIFGEYAALLRTGETQELDFWSPVLHRPVRVVRSRLGDGILVVVRDAHEPLNTKPTELGLAELLGGILEASLNGIISYESIRDAHGTVVDFRFVRFNHAARRMLNLTDETAGKPMLDELPGVKEAGLFDRFVQVVETEQPAHFETSFPAGDQRLWYDMSVVKLGDGFVITFNDITYAKRVAYDVEQIAAQHKQQADFLDSVLNDSPSGIKAVEAVRDERGQIVDFTIIVINKAGARVRGGDVASIVGASLLEVFPGLREAGLFDHYREVVETRQTRHIQTLYGDTWYEMAMAPFGDGLVITYTDLTESIRTQQALEQAAKDNQRQADLLNSVLDGSTNGILALEAVRDHGTIVDFIFLAANKASSQMLRKPVRELIGQRMLVTFPSNEKSGLFEKYVYTVETGDPTHVVMDYPFDGLSGWYDISVRKLGDGVVITYDNVTASRQTALHIQQTADLLQTVINNSPSAIVLYEPIWDDQSKIVDFRYKLVNPIAAIATGRPLEYMQDNTLFTMFPVAAQKGFFDKLVRVFQTGETLQYEHHFLGDDVDLWAEITMVKQGDDVLTVFQYITELKRAQQQLERSTVQLQTVIDTSQTGIFLFTPVRDEAGQVIDFRFRIANRQLSSYVGQKPEAVIGALGSAWFPDYKTNGLFDLYYKTYATGETQRFDFHYDGSGIDVWLDIMSTKMGDEVLVTFGDYTPLKKLQQQLEASVVDLQRSNKNLEQFAYVASHDLQEPLRKIQAFGDIIQGQYAPLIGSEGADMVRRMQSAAARMQVLIKDVLSYSRIATRREAVEAVDLNRLVQDVLDDLETALNEKKAVVNVDRLPTLAGDASQLRQLFQNLLSNALKFSKADHPPRLTITNRIVKGRDAALPVLAVDESRSFHSIDVSDNGIGFEAHHAERIFQVFQRLHGRSHYEGTGIGLAIVQKVVQNHQGYIHAEGRPDEGATFRILLPV